MCHSLCRYWGWKCNVNGTRIPENEWKSASIQIMHEWCEPETTAAIKKDWPGLDESSPASRLQRAAIVVALNAMKIS